MNLIRTSASELLRANGMRGQGMGLCRHLTIQPAE